MTSDFAGEIMRSLPVEFRKVRHSRILWLTVLAFSFVTLIAGLFMYILKDPERARQLGLIGAKAQVFGGAADWSSFFSLVLVLMSVGGLIIFGFIFVWIFGREFSARTVYDMLSLPASRLSIVTAKIITAGYWSLVLMLLVFVLMLAIGAVLQLPGWSAATAIDGLRLLVVTGLLSLVTCLAFSLVASLARGYLAALACIFIALVLAQIITQLGRGQYCPWSIPLLYSGAAEALTGKPPAPLGAVSYAIVGVVGFLSALVTGLWWQYADQT